MNMFSCPIRKLVAAAAAIALGLNVFAAAPASAADAEFVGSLALAIEKDVAEQLGLSSEQRAALLKLIDERESEVLDLVLKLRDAKPEEREAKLAPFRLESEALGFKLLDDKQKDRLEQIRLQRAGSPAFVEPAVAEKLKLTADQQTVLAKLLNERKAELAKVTGQQREVLRIAFEQRAAALLTPEQRAAWGQVTGVARAPAAVAQVEQPEAVAGQSPPAAKPNPENVKLRFNFRYQPWGEVIDWFAEQADLSLIMDAAPPGTLNYIDNREYTPAEALDLMNGVLLTKGYTLIRRERMLMVINLEDGIPPNLVPFVPLEKLDSLGEYELVTTLFRVERLLPEEAQTEIQRLVGPQGSVVILPRAGQLQVTETAGRLRLIRTVLEASEALQASGKGDVRAFQPIHVAVDDALPLLRQLLDIPADGYSAADGSVRLAVDPLSGKLLVGGKPDRVAQVSEIMKAIDVPAPEGVGGAIETPQLEVYDVGASDPASVLAVLQTLMANFADVRLTTDPATGKLVALARPAQHATIRATIDQMQREARLVEVLRLQYVDPQTALTAIGKLFGSTGETAAPGAPKVEIDVETRQLLVRGSAAQIDQIKELLAKMGERLTDEQHAEASTTNVRMLPLGSRSVRNALEQIDAIWPTMRPNRIRVVSPTGNIQSSYPAGERQGIAPPNNALPPAVVPPVAVPTPSATVPAAPSVPAPAPSTPATVPPLEKQTSRGVPVRTVVLRRETLVAQATPANNTAAPPAEKSTTAPAEPAPIIVAPGPTGTMIASDDIEALNQFEALLQSLTSRTMTGGKEFTVFYLQNASAAAAAETLEAVYGGGGSSGGGSLLGDLAGMALGNTGGNIVGAMLGDSAGGPSSIISTSSVLIVPDPRLNALIVQASAADLDLIEQLLRVIDQLDVPESTVNPKPRLIPVRNTGAAQIAEIIREVYQDRLVNTSRQRQPSPEELIQMLRGGRGGTSSGGRRTQAETQKVSIGVDARTNSLIVAAPQALYEEIEQLVATLDQATEDSNQAIRVVTLKRSNPETVQKALSAIVGEKAKTSTTASPSTSGSPSPAPASSGGIPYIGPDPQQIQDMMRQRMEMFNQMRGGFGPRPEGGGFGGGRDGGSRSDGGRPPEGGRR